MLKHRGNLHAFSSVVYGASHKTRERIYPAFFIFLGKVAKSVSRFDDPRRIESTRRLARATLG